MGFHDAHATYVGSLQLRTLDLERAVQFYRQVVGLKTLEQDAGSATLSADGKTPLLSLVQPAGVIPKPPGTTGLYHFALLLPERADLALFIRHLVDKVVRFGASNHLVSEAVYFSDPDGNGIEVYADTDPDTWSWRQSGVAMDTLPLDFQDLMKAAHPMKQAWDGLRGRLSSATSTCRSPSCFLPEPSTEKAWASSCLPLAQGHCLCRLRSTTTTSRSTPGSESARRGPPRTAPGLITSPWSSPISSSWPKPLNG